MLVGNFVEKLGDSVEMLRIVAGRQQSVEGNGGSGSTQLVHLIKGPQCLVKHAGAAVGSDEGGQERLLGDFGVIFVGFNEGFDVSETVGLGEASDGEILGVARRRGRRVVFGDGGINLEGFVRVVLGSEL